MFIDDDTMQRLTGSSTPPTKENISPMDLEGDIDSLKRESSMKVSPSSAMPPSRNSPLSWQRRPTSQSSDRPRSRPLSMVATENAARSPRATPELSSGPAAEPTLSRDQIAQSLASKDPAWFRQTADRGLNSPAYRRNQVEDEDRSDHGLNSSRVQMPGMSRESSEPEKPMDEPIDRSSSQSRSSTAFGRDPRSPNQSTAAAPGGVSSPIPLTSAQRLDPPTLDLDVRMSPSQGRISPDRLDRPTSPTKGMGGFVQSAMMKRSDSVSKRWSVQSPTGLGRGNSRATNRSSHDLTSSLVRGNNVNGTAGVSRPSSLNRENSPLPLSRPTSSYSNATITQEGRPSTANSMRSTMTTSTTNDGFIKPAPPASRSQTPKVSQEETSADSSTHIETTPPTSPSKTMDPKRWSPTKSSWLESALNKPESPKPKPTPPSQQPAWKSEINKAKQKGSIDLGHGTTITPKHEVNIGGLMRSPPPGGLTKPLNIGGIPAKFSSVIAPQARPESGSSQNIMISPDKNAPSETASPSPTSSSKPALLNAKVKPETPPKKDFRTVLKSRPPPTDNIEKEEPEFKNVFGQLRRTKTQNYVAPDELKNNITRGKAALNITGGPKKTERKDEFKEAILQKKESFKKAQLEGKGVERSTSAGSQDVTLPEALAKRQALGRSDSSPIEADSTVDPPVQERTVREAPRPSVHSDKEAIGSKLAGRFNPALAGLLARGPPSTASEPSRSSSPALSQRIVSMSTSTTNAEASEAAPGPQLTHMTKARARGPRRKAPTRTASVMAASPEEPGDVKSPLALKPESSTKHPTDVGNLKAQKPTRIETSPKTDTENTASQPSFPRKLDMKRRSQFLQEAPNKSNNGEPQLDPPKPLSPTKKDNPPEISMISQEPKSETNASPVTKSKPDAPAKSPSLISKTSQRPQQPESPVTAKFQPLSPSPIPPQKPSSTEIPPKTLSFVQPKASIAQNTSQSENPDDSELGSVKSVRNAAAMWNRPSATQPVSNPPQARPPIKLPTQDDEKAAMVGAGLRSRSPVKEEAPIDLGKSIEEHIAHIFRSGSLYQEL